MSANVEYLLHRQVGCWLTDTCLTSEHSCGCGGVQCHLIAMSQSKPPQKHSYTILRASALVACTAEHSKRSKKVLT